MTAATHSSAASNLLVSNSLDRSARFRAGIVYGVAAYGLWGIFPAYFKLIREVPALEVLAHRILWSFVLLAGLTAWRGGWSAVRAVLQQRSTRATLCATTLLIAGNWLVFVWAIANNRVLDASLGYFINPLVNVLLGCVVLRERLTPGQWASVTLATCGVGWLTLHAGGVPVVALFLAVTFGLYGLLRKTVRADALLGLTVETMLLTPMALAYLGGAMAAGTASFLTGAVRTDALLLAAGVVTATPLLWFSEAARRLPLSILGFLQYLAPSGHFLLAVLAFHEPLSRAHFVAFPCIWAALALFSVDAWRRSRTPPRDLADRETGSAACGSTWAPGRRSSTDSGDGRES